MVSLVDHKKQLLRSLWCEVDKNADGKLDRKEIRKLLEKINYQVDEAYFKSIFAKHDKDSSNTIELEEFFAMMEDLTTHPVAD
jgi:Ca2+-binding EF-hand superfamily protein